MSLNGRREVEATDGAVAMPVFDGSVRRLPRCPAVPAAAGSWDKRAGVSPPVAGLMNIAPKLSRIHNGFAVPDPRTALRVIESNLDGLDRLLAGGRARALTAMRGCLRPKTSRHGRAASTAARA